MKKTIFLFLTVFLFSINISSFSASNIDEKWTTPSQGILSFENSSTFLSTQPTITVNISADNDFNLFWKTNVTGEWETFASNISCINGSYSQEFYWANQSNVTYWWFLSIELGNQNNDSKIYNFKINNYYRSEWSDIWLMARVSKFNITSFQPIEFNPKSISFEYSFNIKIENYNSSIQLNVSTKDNSEKPVYPNQSEKKDGEYSFDKVKIPTKSDISLYPFEPHTATIKINTDPYQEFVVSESSTNVDMGGIWKCETQVHNNTINLTFSRVQERNIYYILFFILFITTSVYLIVFFTDRTLPEFKSTFEKINFLIIEIIELISVPIAFSYLMESIFQSRYILLLFVLYVGNIIIFIKLYLKKENSSSNN